MDRQQTSRLVDPKSALLFDLKDSNVKADQQEENTVYFIVTETARMTQVKSILMCLGYNIT